ncbi:MAG: nickel pincer cofactor biosynthesis protein LarC [Methanocalculaceae archaeon]|nr:nickel pincer cofactor biosynthesis protein LarC [Methanocalculaceae archaeon]
MRLLVIDPGVGTTGNMMCGALLAAGANHDTVLCAMQSIVPESSVSQVMRCGMPAWYVDTCAGSVHRTFAEVLEIIHAANAPAAAIDLSKRVFSRIVEAEGKAHRTHQVHFHDAGADDVIAAVLGACAAFVTLAVDAVHILPLSVGFETTSCAHGTISALTPTTVEILRNSDLQVSIVDYPGEQCTPVGAALLAQLSASFGTDKHTGRITSIGCGAGTCDPTNHPSVLRAVVMETENAFFPSVVDILETNVDDASGELLSEVIPTLMNAGARDACLVPVTMKKGRPGYIVRVIAKQSDSERLARMLARETGSLGVRCMPMMHRFVADRRVSSKRVVVNGTAFAVDVKTAFMDGKSYSHKAEFDQVRAIANTTGVSIRDVKQIVEEGAWKKE